MTEKRHILWVDDEIEMLKPHLTFLEQRGYEVTPVANGGDAVDLVRGRTFDLVLLDAMMPGKDGLQTLQEIRQIDGKLPVVMITRNDEQEIMDQAIGRRADDYLLKPVNPNQILAAIRRLLEHHKIAGTQVAKDYVSQYRELDPSRFDRLDHQEWIDTYLRMIDWDMQLDRYRETGLSQTHEDQKRAANYEFCRFVTRHYKSWVQQRQGPELSPDVFRNHVFPTVKAGRRAAFIVVDCMRLDQWITMEPLLAPYFRIDRKHYYSILPSATPYSRNALFSGLFPLEIYRRHPQYWDSQRGEHSLNRFERELLELQLQRLGAPAGVKVRYAKVYNAEEAGEIQRAVQRKADVGLFALVFNFIDVLAHGRSESTILQEIAPDEAAFRSLAQSWFEHSSLFDLLKQMSAAGIEVFVSTDHGAVQGMRPTLATGNRDTSTNVRYKYGENLGSDDKGAFRMEEPEHYMLPKLRSTENYIIAKENFYFVYPTKFRKYEKQFQGSFQHGGISLEEVILPVAHLLPRR
ncbi:MAG TPA: response regulator [Candidatus Krumholzibacteria bacterium]|jgi:CheY-like chemotaxis protein|nr:response regulator [Candidatus Krumholzibacteria bacterium]